MDPVTSTKKQEPSSTDLEYRADKASVDLANAKKALEAAWIGNGGTSKDFDRLINGAGYGTTLNNISGRKLDLASVEKAERMAARISVFTEKLTSTAGDGFDPRSLAGLEGSATKDWRKNSPHEIQLNHLQKILSDDNRRISALRNPDITKLTLPDSELRPEKLPDYPEGYTTRRGPPEPTRPLKPVILNETKNLIPNGSIYGPAPATRAEQAEYFARRSAEVAEAGRTGTLPPAPTLPAGAVTPARTPAAAPAPTTALTPAATPAPGAGRLESSATPSSAAPKPEPRWTTGPITDVLKRACLERPFTGESDESRLARMVYSARTAISGYQPGDIQGRQESVGASFLLSVAGRDRFSAVAAMRTEFFKEYDALVKNYDGSNRGEEFKREVGELIGRHSRGISDYISKEITSRVPSVVMRSEDVAEALVSRRALNEIGTMISARVSTERREVVTAPAAPAPTTPAASTVAKIDPKPVDVTPVAPVTVAPTTTTTPSPVLPEPVKVAVAAPKAPVAPLPPLVTTPPEAAKPVSVVPEGAPDLRTAHAKGASYLVLYLRGGEQIMHDLETGVNYDTNCQVINKDLLRDEGIEIRRTKLNDGTYYVQVGCKLAGDISIEARRGGSPLQQSAVTCGVYEKGATEGSWNQFPLDGAYGLYKISAVARPEAKPVVVDSRPTTPDVAATPQPVSTTTATRPTTVEEPAVVKPVEVKPDLVKSEVVTPAADAANKALAAEVDKASWLSRVPVDSRAAKISFTLNGESVEVDPRDPQSANEKLAKLGIRLKNGSIEFTKRGAFSINETYTSGSGSMSLNV